MRKTYETEEHRENEERIREIIEVKWGCKLEKTERFCAYDFIVRGIVCYVEIKTRTISSYHSGEYMISMKKINAAKKMTKKKPFILVVDFTDQTMWINLTTLENYEVRMGGRIATQRDDQDVESCAYFPMEEFKKL